MLGRVMSRLARREIVSPRRDCSFRLLYLPAVCPSLAPGILVVRLGRDKTASNMNIALRPAFLPTYVACIFVFNYSPIFGLLPERCSF